MKKLNVFTLTVSLLIPCVAFGMKKKEEKVTLYKFGHSVFANMEKEGFFIAHGVNNKNKKWGFKEYNSDLYLKIEEKDNKFHIEETTIDHLPFTIQFPILGLKEEDFSKKCQTYTQIPNLQLEYVKKIKSVKKEIKKYLAKQK